MTDIALLDGGVGQEIQKRSKTKAHPLWSVKIMLEQPDIVTQVHRDFNHLVVTSNQFSLYLVN